MSALGYPVFFQKSSGLFQGSRNVRALTTTFFSQPSLKYLSLSMRMLKEQCSLPKGAYVCMCMHMHAFMCVCGLLVLDQVPAMGYSEMNAHCLIFWKCQEPHSFIWHCGCLELGNFFVVFFLTIYTLWQGKVLAVWT